MCDMRPIRLMVNLTVLSFEENRRPSIEPVVNLEGWENEKALFHPVTRNYAASTIREELRSEIEQNST